MCQVGGVLPTLAVLHAEGDIMGDGRVLRLKDGEVGAAERHLWARSGTHFIICDFLL